MCIEIKKYSTLKNQVILEWRLSMQLQFAISKAVFKHLSEEHPTSLGTSDCAETQSQVGSTGDCWAKQPFAPAAGSPLVYWNISATLNLTTRDEMMETSRCVLSSGPVQSLTEVTTDAYFPWDVERPAANGNSGNLTLMGSGCYKVRAEAFNGNSLDSLQHTRYHIMFCRLFQQEHQKNL